MAVDSEQINPSTRTNEGENRPLNVPSYDNLLQISNLTPAIFPPEKYDRYKQSLNERMRLLTEQTRYLKDQLGKIQPHYDGGSSLFKGIYDITSSELSLLSYGMGVITQQHALLPDADKWFLVEHQIDSGSNQVRDLKTALASIYSIGGYQSISLESTGEDQIGPGQLARDEIATGYARFDLAPATSEKHFGELIPTPEAISKGTFLCSSGMAGLTTALAYTRAEHPNASYLIGNNLYFENDRYVTHLAEQVGIDNISLFNTDSELDSALEQDPEVIFVEPVSNSQSMTTTDLLKVVSSRTQHPKRTIIVDYTVCGTNYDFTPVINALDDKTTLVLTTSMQKVYEEGDDITPAGMVTMISKDSDMLNKDKIKFSGLRSMLGTNITQNGLLLLQQLDPETVKAYSQAIGRNVHELQEAINSWGNPLVKSISAAPSKDNISQGMVMYLRLAHGPLGNVITNLLAEARREHIMMTDGYSFGFRHIRIAPVSTDPPIIRIAPGIENPRELEILKSIFEKALTTNVSSEEIRGQ